MRKLILAIFIGLTCIPATHACAGEDYMPIGPAVSPPSGWIDLCRRDELFCKQEEIPNQIIDSSTQVWDMLYKINIFANQYIRPVSDYDQYGVEEYWSNSDDIVAGDCEDVAIAKQKALQQAGFPLSALLLATARDDKNEGHTVLVARMSNGEFVLDNRRDEIRLWSTAGLSFRTRQSTWDTNQWVWIEHPETPVNVNHKASTYPPGQHTR